MVSSSIVSDGSQNENDFTSEYLLHLYPKHRLNDKTIRLTQRGCILGLTHRIDLLVPPYANSPFQPVAHCSYHRYPTAFNTPDDLYHAAPSVPLRSQASGRYCSGTCCCKWFQHVTYTGCQPFARDRSRAHSAYVSKGREPRGIRRTYPSARA